MKLEMIEGAWHVVDYLQLRGSWAPTVLSRGYRTKKEAEGALRELRAIKAMTAKASIRYFNSQ